jgi:hypothetical protein
MNHPDIVSTIVGQTAEKLAVERLLKTRFDLRLYSKRMHGLQRKLRTESSKRRAGALHSARQHRLRARRPLSEAEVEQVYSTYDGGRYARLSNGQVVSVDVRTGGNPFVASLAAKALAA